MAFKHIELPDDYLRAIGLICLRWSLLEDEVQAWIWHLSNVQINRGMAMTSHLGFRERFGALITLTEIRTGATESAKLKEIYRRIVNGENSMLNRRNRYIHWPWAYNEHGQLGQWRQQARMGLKLKWEKRSVDDLTRLASEIAEETENVSYVAKNANLLALRSSP